MDPGPSTQDKARSKGWLTTLWRTLDSLIRIHHHVEEVRSENQTLRRQVAELTKLVHYQAGQIQQIDQRIRDAVEAQVLRELDRRMADRRTSGGGAER